MHDQARPARADIQPNASTGSSAQQSATETRSRKAAIAIRAQSILSQFWTDDAPDELRAIELEGWVDVLGGVSVDELRRAWAEYQTTGPRSQSGRLARPDAGALYGRIIAARVTAAIINSPPRVQIAAPAPEPRMSGARAAEILAEVGFRPKEFAVPPVTPKEHLK